MRYIGDVHGKWDGYKEIIADCGESIQVGDFGVAFRPYGSEPYDNGPIVGFPSDPVFPEGHRFIRGNHDNPAVCAKHPNWIADCTVEGDNMFVGGAYSIDKDYRTPGIDWWDDEELSYPALNRMIDTYEEVKPRIMVTHECPEEVARHVFPFYVAGQYPSSTRDAFQQAFTIHKPEIWLHGHFHYGVDVNIFGTRFICLPELAYIDITEDDPSSGEIVLYNCHNASVS